METLCPDPGHFFEEWLSFRIWIIWYLCRTTLIPCAVSCSIMRKSSNFRLSIFKNTLFMNDERVEFELILCISLCVLLISNWWIFSTSYVNGSCGSKAVELWLGIISRGILASCGSSALKGESFICPILISGALLTYAFLDTCTILSANVFICSHWARVNLSRSNFACVCHVFWNFWRNVCQFFLISSVKCEHLCCAGQIKDVCIMAVV